jgi:hypothetical protein
MKTRSRKRNLDCLAMQLTVRDGGDLIGGSNRRARRAARRGSLRHARLG